MTIPGDTPDRGPGTHLVPASPDAPVPVLDQHGPYALARLKVARVLEELCGSKVHALDALARLEAALWASALLHQPDAARAREAFGCGLVAFAEDLR